MPRLLVHAVTDKGARSYLSQVWNFLGFAKKEREELGTVADLDRALTWNMDHMCYEQKKGH